MTSLVVFQMDLTQLVERVTNSDVTGCISDGSDAASGAGDQ